MIQKPHTNVLFHHILAIVRSSEQDLSYLNNSVVRTHNLAALFQTAEYRMEITVDLQMKGKHFGLAMNSNTKRKEMCV